MTYQAASLILKVRDLISDDQGPEYRWTDSTMVDWINEAASSMFESHPEFYYTTEVVTTLPVTELGLYVTAKEDSMETTQTGQKLLINYVAYRCLSRDNEDPETMQAAGRFLEIYGMGV